MGNVHGLGDMGQHMNIGAAGQAGEVARLEKIKKEIRSKLKNLTPREARKKLEMEYGRDISDPAEKEIIEQLTEEIQKNAEKLV
ncbi:MAG: hypothetical protein WC838_03970 [Candidatus Margulisiibacteriota bacterium]|jgi:hypothetical protein